MSFETIQFKTFLPLALILLISACGGQSTPITTADQNPKPSAPPVNNVAPQGNTDGSHIPGGIDVQPNVSPEDVKPDFTTDFTIKGDQSVTGSIPPTDNHLYIGIKAQSTGGVENYPNYTIALNCAKFSIKVGSSSQTVFVSTTGDDISERGNPCDGAKSVDIRNFDSEVQPGHNSLKIEVKPLNYDNCGTFGNIFLAGCPLHVLNSHHIISGTILLYTNKSNVEGIK